LGEGVRDRETLLPFLNHLPQPLKGGWKRS